MISPAYLHPKEKQGLQPWPSMISVASTEPCGFSFIGNVFCHLGLSRCAHPTPFCSAQQCHVWNPNSASQALAHWCLPDWLWGWKAQHGMEVHKFQENIINIWVYGICVLSNHKRTFSVSMSHSNLATQWEAVGTLRDKARKLELAPSL